VNPSNNALRPFLVFCGLIVVTACLYWAQEVLIPIALAILLTFIMAPAVTALQRRGLPRVVSVLLVVTLVFALVGGFGWVITRQVGALAQNISSDHKKITAKLNSLFGADRGVGLWGNVQGLIDQVSEQIEASNKTAKPGEVLLPGETPKKPMYVQMAPSGWSRFSDAIGPAARGLATTFLVVVLVIFMLMQRENLRNRVVQLVGGGRVIVTTRAIDEGARRISRYLIMLVCVNTGVGVALAAGLFLLGLFGGQPQLCQYALLWGFVVGSLRFVPYLGSWLAAALLLLFDIAMLDGWSMTIATMAYFVCLELLTANAVEPLVFGHSTGSSPVALLVAAAFWTWLWGPVGLILSTPLTVIMVVLGKYVPGLQFFEVLLGDQPSLNMEVTFYQRLVARDQDEASDLVEDYLQTHSVEATYEEVVLPALVLARRDRQEGLLDPEDLDFVYRATRDIIEELSSLQAPPPEKALKAGEQPGPPKVLVLGCPARDEADELALLIFQQTLRHLGYGMETVSAQVLTAEVLERVTKHCHPVVLIASLPPGGVAQARYLCKRIRAQCPQVKIAVGRWGETENLERMQKRLHAAGADYAATTLQETRTQVVPLLQVAAAAPRAEPQTKSAEPKLAHR
jgi:predicted PurR-regulated permease PerM